jgi:hypothetical protein
MSTDILFWFQVEEFSIYSITGGQILGSEISSEIRSEVALGRAFLSILIFLVLTTTPPLLHTHVSPPTRCEIALSKQHIIVPPVLS